MKTKFLLALAVITSLSTAHFVRANAEPEVFAVQKDEQDMRDVLLSPDGTLLCVSDGAVQTIYDVKTHSPLWQTAFDEFFFSSDGLTVIAPEDISNAYPRWPSESHIVFHVLEARTGKQLRDFSDLVNRIPVKPTKGKATLNSDENEDEILETSFNATGSEFLVATRYFLRRFDVKKGRLMNVTKWHTSSQQNIRLSSAVFSSDSKTVFSTQNPERKTNFGTQDNIHIFSVQNAQQTRVIKAPVTYIADISPNSSLLVTQTQEWDGVDFVRASDGHKLWSLPDFTSDYVGLSPDGKTVFAISKRGLDIHNALTGRKLKTIVGLTNQNIAPSPDGKWLYEAHGGKIYRWQTT